MTQRQAGQSPQELRLGACPFVCSRNAADCRWILGGVEIGSLNGSMTALGADYAL
jgi:hypothetical protein